MEVTDDEAEMDEDTAESPSKVEQATTKGHAGHKHSHRIDKNAKVHHEHGAAAHPSKRVKV